MTGRLAPCALAGLLAAAGCGEAPRVSINPPVPVVPMASRTVGAVAVVDSTVRLTGADGRVTVERSWSQVTAPVSAGIRAINGTLRQCAGATDTSSVLTGARGEFVSLSAVVDTLVRQARARQSANPDPLYSPSDLQAHSRAEARVIYSSADAITVTCEWYAMGAGAPGFHGSHSTRTTTYRTFDGRALAFRDVVADSVRVLRLLRAAYGPDSARGWPLDEAARRGLAVAVVDEGVRFLLGPHPARGRGGSFVTTELTLTWQALGSAAAKPWRKP